MKIQLAANYKFYLGLTLLFFSWNGCIKEDTKGPLKPKPIGKLVTTVYIAGTNGTNAYLWTDGVSKVLPNEEQEDGAYGLSVSVSGGSIYVGGFADKRAVIWKDGKVSNLSDGQNWSAVNSVFVRNTDVYAAGYDGDMAMFWKNGKGTPLGTGYSKSAANGLFLKGTDVYVAGYRGPIACLWKNGTPTNLRSGNSRIGVANGVYVKGQDVYVVGHLSSGTQGVYTAQVWKNNVATPLTDGTKDADATAIYVTDKEVYVTGYEKGANGKSIAMLWKNGLAVKLSDGTSDSYAYGIDVLGEDVYVVGHEDYVGQLWKNGVVSEIYKPAICYDIAVDVRMDK